MTPTHYLVVKSPYAQALILGLKPVEYRTWSKTLVGKTIAIVNMSEKDEVATNIALNNTAAMGEFDYAAIQNLASKWELDLEADLLFGRDEMLVSFSMDMADAQVQTRTASADPELMQEIKDRKQEVREKFKNTRELEGDYTTKPKGILTLVFDDEEKKLEFLRSHSLPLDSSVVHSETIWAT